MRSSNFFFPKNRPVVVGLSDFRWLSFLWDGIRPRNYVYPISTTEKSWLASLVRQSRPLFLTSLNEWNKYFTSLSNLSPESIICKMFLVNIDLLHENI